MLHEIFDSGHSSPSRFCDLRRFLAEVIQASSGEILLARSQERYSVP